jgi:hypothetical protein
MSKWIAIVAMFAALGAGTSACSESTGTEQPAVCDSLAAVVKSIDEVKKANVSENGLNQLRIDLQRLRANLQELYTDAQAQFATQVQAVREAVDNFADTIATARATPNAANFSTVRSAFTAVQDDVRSLSDAVAGSC